MLHLCLCFLCFCFQLSVFSAQDEPCSYPIDVVYLWVDGKDDNWLAVKNYYEQLEQREIQISPEACQNNRFWDHEELRYSLRSIIKFAPFFRHIYIITMNQRPKWLVDHPQITIIDHQEIFENPQHLPTFNSQALECHLHRIPGLSEHFIYFNDDVFLGRPIHPTDFFTEEGKVQVLFERGWTVSPNPVVQSSLYRKAWLNSSALLDTYFVTEPRHRLCHAPFALRTSWIQEVESLFPFVIHSNSSHRFRDSRDFNITNGLFQYIWLYQDRVVRGNLTNKMVSLYNDESFLANQVALSNILVAPPHTFCLQDCILGDSPKTCELLQTFLQTFLPDPAPWEQSENE